MYYLSYLLISIYFCELYETRIFSRQDYYSVRDYSATLINNTTRIMKDIEKLLKEERSSVSNGQDLLLMMNLMDVYASVYIHRFSRLLEVSFISFLTCRWKLWNLRFIISEWYCISVIQSLSQVEVRNLEKDLVMIFLTA